ncbi:RloB family protein [Leptothrix ochracea]|uniref:RloB family protein n=2 Tax=Leptothrix ochracea TaxID=735331 RepID=UPI0034E21747
MNESSARSMGKDHQPKHRQVARVLTRRAAVRQPYDRLLIVCEGEKTEPRYLQAIQREYRLSTAHVQVLASHYGTAPMQVVEYAERIFRQGDRDRGIQAGAFDRIMAVFDRDDHPTYHAALAKADALNGKLSNDDGMQIPFEVIASVPCFELWLLLHYEDVQASLSPREAVDRLWGHLPSYQKGQGDHWAVTKNRLEAAIVRAIRLAASTTAYDGTEPYTAMHELVLRLVHLKDCHPLRGKANG